MSERVPRINFTNPGATAVKCRAREHMHDWPDGGALGAAKALHTRLKQAIESSDPFWDTWTAYRERTETVS